MVSTNPKIEILLLGYLRPKETLKILGLCHEHTEHGIHLFLDGAKNSPDYEIQKEMTAVVRTNFPKVSVHHSPINKGCKEAILGSLQKALEISTADIFIVIEDDCIPTKEFFEMITDYRQELLSGVLAISGKTTIEVLNPPTVIYSNYVLIHGWAMSRACLQEMLHICSNLNLHQIKKTIPWTAKVSWLLNKLKVEANIIDTWDAHWMLASWRMKELTLVSSQPLIANVGQISTRDPRSSPKVSIKSVLNTNLRSSASAHDSVLLKNFFRINRAKAFLWLMEILRLKLILLFRHRKSMRGDSHREKQT